MAEKREFKNKQKCQKLMEPEKLHARKLPLLQYTHYVYKFNMYGRGGNPKCRSQLDANLWQNDILESKIEIYVPISWS